ncbi:uncharacterized protein PAC_03584 [Phialocephala subalpina]|uniref:Uncharacterized protein n=1 Tax=Phialocephala subalpina TaxID=576137 RepID=A0A1L7WLQ2_9HELO|nr:uncharacterized protein PAC_03584 [Phialocephala subalpina]
MFINAIDVLDFHTVKTEQDHAAHQPVPISEEEKTRAVAIVGLKCEVFGMWEWFDASEQPDNNTKELFLQVIVLRLPNGTKRIGVGFFNNDSSITKDPLSEERIRYPILRVNDSEFAFVDPGSPVDIANLVWKDPVQAGAVGRKWKPRGLCFRWTTQCSGVCVYSLLNLTSSDSQGIAGGLHWKRPVIRTRPWVLSFTHGGVFSASKHVTHPLCIVENAWIVDSSPKHNHL